VPQRLDPSDPREWLNRARSDLTLASAQVEGVYLEDLCFHAQQAAEKAIKAVFIHRGLRFPYSHDLAFLLSQLESSGEQVPEAVRQAERLTPFAVASRYPGVSPPVDGDQYQEAVRLAQTVLRWAEAVVSGS